MVEKRHACFYCRDDVGEHLQNSVITVFRMNLGHDQSAALPGIVLVTEIR